MQGFVEHPTRVDQRPSDLTTLKHLRRSSDSLAGGFRPTGLATCPSSLVTLVAYSTSGLLSAPASFTTESVHALTTKSLTYET